MSADGYAGDLSPKDAWKVLSDDPKAVLVDCRTMPEWNFVGVPDLGPLGKETVFVPWQVYPAMEQNAEFVAQVTAAGAEKDSPVLFLCRSGVRSVAAARAATAAGFGKAFNVSEGFEGDVDGDGHRGVAWGWKAAELSWRQR